MLGNLDNFFDKVRILLNSEEKIKDDIIALITLHTSYSPTRAMIRIQSGIAFINCHPAVKSELYLKRADFIDELKRVTGNKIVEIR